MIIWKDDVDYPDYFKISNDGQVYSKRTNRILVQGTLKNGYKVISSKIGGRSGKSICLKVHRMVAKSFISNIDNKPMVNHIDGDKTNNHVSNLEWCTASENTQHAYDTGLKTIKYGVDNHSSMLTQEQVDYIRNNYIPRDKIFSGRALAKKFNISHCVIMEIINKTRY